MGADNLFRNATADVVYLASQRRTNTLAGLTFQNRGGGNRSTMEPNVPWKDYVEKANEAVEANVRAATADLASKVDRVNGRLNQLPTVGTVVWTAFGTVVSIVGLIVAIQAYAYSRYDNGVATSGVFTDDVLKSREQRRADAEGIAAIASKVDALTAAIRARNAGPIVPTNQPP